MWSLAGGGAEYAAAGRSHAGIDAGRAPAGVAARTCRPPVLGLTFHAADHAQRHVGHIARHAKSSED